MKNKKALILATTILLSTCSIVTAREAYVSNYTSFSPTQSRNDYNVSVRLLKADGSGSPSMAASAINSNARVVENNGLYTYYISFQTMNMGSLSGSVSNLWVYINGAKIQAQSEGNGTWSFTSSNKESQIRCATYVDVMGAAPDAILAFDWSGSGGYGNNYFGFNTTNNIDRSALYSQIMSSSNLNQSIYTSDSFHKFYLALIQAENVYNNEFSNQNQINQEVQNLYNARNNLKIMESTKSNDNFAKSSTDLKAVKNIYELPVKLMKSDGGSESMANGALVQMAKVEEIDGQYFYYVEFKGLTKEFGGQILNGNVTNLIVQGVPAKLENGKWVFQDIQKQNLINCTVWVDIMDQMVGGRPGAGQQNAILSFDWSNARLVSTNNKNNQTKKELNEDTILNEKSKKNRLEFLDTVNHWAKSAIDYSVNKGYFKGTSDNYFEPDRDITKGEFVTVLGRIANIEKNKYDSKGEKFYSLYVDWAKKTGLVEGMAKEFNPQDSLTREEMAFILDKYVKSEDIVLRDKHEPNYKDSSKISSWARDSVNNMSRKGLLKGMENGNFSPKTKFNRAQITQVIYNLEHID